MARLGGWLLVVAFGLLWLALPGAVRGQSCAALPVGEPAPGEFWVWWGNAYTQTGSVAGSSYILLDAGGPVMLSGLDANGQPFAHELPESATIGLETVEYGISSSAGFGIEWCAAGVEPEPEPTVEPTLVPTASATPELSPTAEASATAEATPEPEPVAVASTAGDSATLEAMATQVAILSGDLYTMTVEAPAINKYIGGGLQVIAMLMGVVAMFLLVIVVRGR